MIKGRKSALGAMAVVALVVVAFFASEYFRGTLGLEKSLEQLKARGEKLTMAELKPVAVSAESNAAAIFLGSTTARRSILPDELRPPMGRMAVPGRAVVGSRLTDWGVPKKGATNHVPADWNQLRSALELNREYLAQLRECLQRPGFHSGYDYDAGFTTSQPSILTGIKSALQMLGASTMLSLHQGEKAAALADMHDQIRLCDHLADEPIIISQLVRIACAAISLNTTWELLQADGWTDEELAGIQQAWLRRDYLSVMLRSLEAERVMSLDYFRQLKLSPALREQMIGGLLNPIFSEAAPRNEFILRWIHVPLWRTAWADQDTLNNLQQWNRIIDLGRMAQTNGWNAVVKLSGASTPPDETWELFDFKDDENHTFYDRCRYLFSSQSSGVSEILLSKAVRMETHRNLAVAAIAVKRFALRHGELPASLSDLVPQFLEKVPTDRMDGEPLRYRPGADGTFLLYSVGEDFKDDGGDPSPTRTQLYLWNCKDAVWPSPASPEEVEQLRKEGKLE